jgi:Outer membrane protein beta-barrel domain
LRFELVQRSAKKKYSMKFVSKFLFLTLLGVCSGIISYSQISIWPKVGGNFAWSTYRTNVQGVSSPQTPLCFGYSAGVAVDIPLSTNISLRPAIIYSKLNVSWNYSYPVANNYNGGFYQREYHHIETRRYLSVPINVVFHYKIGGNQLLISGGPYLSRALDGNFAYDYNDSQTFGSTTVSGEYGYGSGKLKAGKVPEQYLFGFTYYNSLDIGFSIGAGYQIKRFLFSAQLGVGLTNTQPHYSDTAPENSRDSTKSTNRNFSFGIGYRVL